MSNISTHSSELESVLAIPTVDANRNLFQHEIEAELLGPIPRRVHLSAKSRAIRFWLWNLIIGIGLVCFYLERQDIAHWEALRVKGVPLQATVTSKEESFDGEKTSRFVYYRFDAENVTYKAGYHVSQVGYDMAKKGDLIPITYLPGSHGTIWEQGQASRNQQNFCLLWWIVIFISATLPFSISLLRYGWAWHKESSLLKNGTAVTACAQSGTVNTSEDMSYSITYRFLANNNWGSGTLDVTLAQYVAFTEGMPYFTVIHDPECIDRHSPYFQMRSILID